MRTSSARQQGFENKPRLGFKLLPGHGNPHFRSLGVIFLLWRQDNAQFVALRVTQTTPNTVCFNPKALQVVPILGHRARFGGGSVTGGVDSGTPGGVQQGKRDRWCRFRDTGRGAEKVRARCGRSVAAVRISTVRKLSLFSTDPVFALAFPEVLAGGIIGETNSPPGRNSF